MQKWGVNLPSIKAWTSTRITELLGGHEDEVLVEFVSELLEGGEEELLVPRGHPREHS